jgi:hypothetical protein
MLFKDLIHPASADEFFDQTYDRAPFVARSERAETGFFGWADLNGLLAQSGVWTSSSLRLMENGDPVAPELYCTETRTTQGPVLRPVPALVNVFLADGASLVANELQALSPEIAALAGDIARTLAAEVGVNAYCSFGGVQAFGTHYDIHDVLVLQCEGEKTWRLYGRQPDNPDGFPPGAHAEVRRWFEASRGPLTRELTLRPGDVLYLPRGWFHDAMTDGEASLHLTFSATPLTGRAIFKLLEAAAMQSGLFRAWLPDGAVSGEALQSHLAELTTHLGRIAGSPAFRDEIRMAQQRQVGRVTEYQLPVRRPLTFLRATGIAGPAFSGPVAVAMDWAFAQPGFAVEEFVARFDFVREEDLLAALKSAQDRGALSVV